MPASGGPISIWRSLAGLVCQLPALSDTHVNSLARACPEQGTMLPDTEHRRSLKHSAVLRPADPHVRAERHYHPVKAQLVTAAGMGGLAVAATALLAPMLGVSPWSLVGVEQAFWACMVCASAGEPS